MIEDVFKDFYQSEELMEYYKYVRLFDQIDLDPEFYPIDEDL